VASIAAGQKLAVLHAKFTDPVCMTDALAKVKTYGCAK
jgi:hypothetical protein